MIISFWIFLFYINLSFSESFSNSSSTLTSCVLLVICFLCDPWLLESFSSSSEKLLQLINYENTKLISLFAIKIFSTSSTSNPKPSKSISSSISIFLSLYSLRKLFINPLPPLLLRIYLLLNYRQLLIPLFNLFSIDLCWMFLVNDLALQLVASFVSICINLIFNKLLAYWYYLNLITTLKMVLIVHT